MDYIVLDSPELSEVVKLIKEHSRTHVIILYLNCKVIYDGRARSVLNYDNRIFISKPDGSLLIHSGTKREPINWQTPGCILTAKIEDDLLVIRSVRSNPRENVWIYSPCVYTGLACKCSEDEFILWGSESEMVDEVMKNPSIIDDGFKPIRREVETPYGKIDLIGEDSSGNTVIIEFKRSTAQLQAVSQLKRYVDYYKAMGKNVRGILVAPNITSSARKLLLEYGLEYRKLKPKLSSLDNLF